MKQTIQLNDCQIKQHHQTYTIFFSSPRFSLVKSVLHTKLVNGAYTDDCYKTITFNAYSVKTLREHVKQQKQADVTDLMNMVRCLSKQLNYLIEQEKKTWIGYNIHDIIVINDERFLFLNDELMTDIVSVKTEMAILYSPFSPKEIFISPELVEITSVPSFFHFKACYFSLGCLLLYCWLREPTFYQMYVQDKDINHVTNSLNQCHWKESKFYWLLSKCLLANPVDRSILLV